MRQARWKPIINSTYWNLAYLDSKPLKQSFSNIGAIFLNSDLKANNYFRTKKTALKALKGIKAVLKKYRGT